MEGGREGGRREGEKEEGGNRRLSLVIGQVNKQNEVAA